MSRVKNVYQLAASRRPRRRRPTSQGGMIALAIVGAALIIAGVLVGLHMRKEHLAHEAVAKMEQAMDEAMRDAEAAAADTPEARERRRRMLNPMPSEP